MVERPWKCAGCGKPAVDDIKPCDCWTCVGYRDEGDGMEQIWLRLPGEPECEEAELASLKAEVEKLKGERDDARDDHIRRNNDATDFGVALRLSEARAEALQVKLDKAKEALTRMAFHGVRAEHRSQVAAEANEYVAAGGKHPSLQTMALIALSELSEARDGN